MGEDVFYHENPPRRPVYYHQPTQYQYQSQGANPQQSNVESSQPLTGEPLKELRTYKRNGTELIEEYERLNPDGTVTKTVTVGDKKDGLKHYSVYKMDKSGIIRKVDNPDPNKYMPKNETEESYAWLDFLKKMEAKRIKKGQQEQLEKINKANMPYPKFGAYNPEEGQMIYYPDENSNSLQALSQLTQEQRDEIFNDYKEKVLHYGTKKLKKSLEKKLEGDGYKRETLTEEQKQTLIDYGVKKLQKLLENNMNEQKNVLDFQIDNKDDFPMPEEYLKPRKPPIAFNIQPDDKMHKKSANMGEKSVSFGIRPEYKTKTNEVSTELDNQKDSMFDRFKTFWKDNLYRKSKNTNSETNTNKSLVADDTDDTEELDATLYKLRKTLAKYLNNDKTYDNSPKYKQQKEEVIEHAFNGMVSILRDCQDKKRLKEMIEDTNAINEDFGESEIDESKSNKQKSKKDKSKKVYNSQNEDEEDYDTDDYLKSLNKMLKKERLDKEGRNHKHDSKNRKMISYESESGDEYLKHEKSSKKEDKQDKWWNWSSIFGGGKDEDKNKNDKPKKGKKDLDFDTFLQQVRDTLSKDIHETPKKVDKDSYSRKAVSYDTDLYEKQRYDKSTQKKEEKGVDFDTLISKIQKAQQDPKPVSYSTRQNNNMYKDQTDKKTGYNEKSSSQGVGHKSYVDTLLDKIRDTMKLVPDENISSNLKNIKDNNNKYPTASTNMGHAQQFKQDENGMSFHIKPQIFGSGKFIQPSNQETNTGMEKITSSAGFVPWWFNQTPESPVRSGDNTEYGSNLLNGSFFSSPLLN